VLEKLLVLTDSFSTYAMKVLMWLLLVLNLIAVKSEASSSFSLCKRNKSFETVLLLDKDPYASPNLTLLEEVFLDAYNHYITKEDCDSIHFRQVQSVAASIPSDNKVIQWIVVGTCVDCDSHQGLFDYNSTVSTRHSCTCLFNSNKLPSEQSFVEYLNEALEEYLEEESLLDDHMIYPARMLKPSCPLGDLRVDCMLEKKVFLQDVRVTFTTGNDDTETPSEFQLQQLGEMLAELYNDYADRIVDPRVVCHVELAQNEDASTSDGTQIYTFTIAYDEKVAPGLSQVFGALWTTPSVQVQRDLLQELPNKCWLSANTIRQAVFADRFVEYVNEHFSEYVLDVFESIVAISKNDPTNVVESLLGLVQTTLTISVDANDISLTRTLGIEIGILLNAKNRQLCDDLRVTRLREFHPNTTTGGSSRRRLGGSYSYDAQSKNKRIGCGGCSRRRVLGETLLFQQELQENDEMFNPNDETCVCLSRLAPRQAVDTDYQDILTMKQTELGGLVSLTLLVREDPTRGCPAVPNEKYQTFGLLMFNEELSAEDIIKVEQDFCKARNRAYEENCTPGYLECLGVQLRLVEGNTRRRQLDSSVQRKLGGSYVYTETTACRSGTCPANRRVGGGGRRLEETERAWAPRGIYADFCVCVLTAGVATRTLPTDSQVLRIFERIKRVDKELIEVTEEDVEDDICERDDIQTEIVTVIADLTSCGGANDGVIITDFCAELTRSYNKLSANVCDPRFRKITDCSFVESPERRNLGAGHRRLGTYTHKVTTTNARIGGGNRKLLSTQKAKESSSDAMPLFRERLLIDESGDPIDECKCFGDNPTFLPVTDEAWKIELGIELQKTCQGSVVDDLEVTPAPRTEISECAAVTEKFQSFGTVTFDQPLGTAEDIQAAGETLCYSLNSQYAELCSAGFLKCLDATLNVPVRRRRQLGVGSERRLESTYTYTTTTRCGQACSENKRISAGQTSTRLLKEADIHRMLLDDFSSDYTDLCTCPADLEVGQRALEGDGRLPTAEEIKAAFNSFQVGVTMTMFTESAPEDEECDRNDTVTQVISVEASLGGCDNTGREVNLEEDFCDVLKESFNKLSADFCDPSFAKIETCQFLGSVETEAARLEDGIRKLGRKRYSYNTSTQQKNVRIGGQGTSGRRALTADQVQMLGIDGKFLLGERLLDDNIVDPIDQCKCFSDSTELFKLVTSADWLAELRRELNGFCSEAEVTSIESEGYPVPCNDDDQGCSIQFRALLGEGGEFPDTALGEFFDEVYSSLANDSCGDYLGRGIVGIRSINVEEEISTEEWIISVQFRCLGGCDILPGQPSIFDTAETVLIPCSESFCEDNPRAPTIDEFISKWKDLNIGDFASIPDLVSLEALESTGVCEADTSTETTTTPPLTTTVLPETTTTPPLTTTVLPETTTTTTITCDNVELVDTSMGLICADLNSSPRDNLDQVICNDLTCSMDETDYAACCNPTCENYECSIEGWVPVATNTTCESGACDDTVCECQLTCASYVGSCFVYEDKETAVCEQDACTDLECCTYPCVGETCSDECFTFNTDAVCLDEICAVDCCVQIPDCG